MTCGLREASAECGEASRRSVDASERLGNWANSPAPRAAFNKSLRNKPTPRVSRFSSRDSSSGNHRLLGVKNRRDDTCRTHARNSKSRPRPFQAFETKRHGKRPWRSGRLWPPAGERRWPRRRSRRCTSRGSRSLPFASPGCRASRPLSRRCSLRGLHTMSPACLRALRLSARPGGAGVVLASAFDSKEFWGVDTCFSCVEVFGYKWIAVGMALSGHPPHRSRRAELPHRAPASGNDVLSRILPPHVFGRAHGAGLPGLESRTWFARPNFPWPSPFPPDAPPGEVSPAACSRPSKVLWACLTSRYRSSWLYFNS